MAGAIARPAGEPYLMGRTSATESGERGQKALSFVTKRTGRDLKRISMHFSLVCFNAKGFHFVNSGE